MEAPHDLIPHSLCELCRAICDASPILCETAEREPTTEPSHLAQLCEPVQAIQNDSSDIQYVEKWRFHDFDALLASVHRGCHLCSVFWSALDEDESRKGSQLFFFVSKVGWKTTAVVSKDFKGGEMTSSGLYMFSREWGSVTNLSSPTTFSAQPNLKYTCDLIRRWLGKCEESHSLCNSNDDGIIRTNELPTRLIDIYHPDRPRLVLATDIQEQVNYITLSHCWGDGMTANLTGNTINSWKERIEGTELTTKFKDAFSVARCLSIRYIWIDSLCILQDSEEDWCRESARMSMVYSNGFLNLVCSSSSSSDGFFNIRHPLSSQDCRIFWKENSNYQFVFRRAQPLRPHQIFPVLSRAWVSQEQLLSRRNVYLGGNIIVWDCCVKQHHEFTFESNYYSDVSTGKQDFFQAMLRQRHYSKADRPEWIGRFWELLVQNYTVANLTFASDQVFAIAGIAVAIQEATQWTYVCGMWYEYLQQQLTWHIAGLPKCKFPRPRLKSTKIPSWSWLSIRHPVNFWLERAEGNPRSYKATIIDCSVTPLKGRAAVAGEVERAILQVTGIFRTLQHCSDVSESWNQYKYQHAPTGIEVIPDISLPDGLPIHFFTISIYQRKRMLPEREGNEFGLVLTPIGSSTEDFTRVGYFERQPLLYAENYWPLGEERTIRIH
ncbi:heterokaryon incompatibility protein-domain-containing protein [Leptodontidium sp. 2 PMI_412]|nr:heterokaryon incompatibility protein-domain-containing protein [Leptodontidium sp. 2 PMI_412]